MLTRSASEQIHHFSKIPISDFRTTARNGFRPALHLVREALARSTLHVHRRGRGPMAVFLPSGPPEGATLLRIYNIADALRSRGWRTAVVPPKLNLAARRRFFDAAAADVLVMQGARHALNRPALYPGWPILYDMDDADFYLNHLAGPVTEAMRQVSAVIAGSRYVADWALAQGAANAHVIWTGTPASTPSAWSQRLPVVAWAQTHPERYHREAALVARVMARVAVAVPGVTLRLYDRHNVADGAFLERFRTPGLNLEWRPRTSYAEYLDSFDDVAIGLAPLCPETPFSRGKSFGKVLAYLDRQVAVVGSDAGEHAAFFIEGTGIISNDESDWVDGIVRLLKSSALRHQMVSVARSRFEGLLCVDAAAEGLSRVMAQYCSTSLQTEPRSA